MVDVEREHHPGTKIEVNDLDFWYGSEQVLFGITMRIPAERITALIGPSGCGKSTFLRAFNRMNEVVEEESRCAGSIRIDGTDIYAPGTDLVKLRRKVGMVFQQSNPFPKSIFDNVAYGPRIHGVAGGTNSGPLWSAA